MAQATGGMTFRNCSVFLTTNSASYTDVSGWGNEIKLSGGEREIAELRTFSGETPFIAAGKRTPVEIELTLMYTEGSTDPFEVVRTAYETATPTPVYIRWSPRGLESTTTGEFVYTTDAVYVTGMPYPQGPADGSTIITFPMKGTCSTVTKSTSTS